MLTNIKQFFEKTKKQSVSLFQRAKAFIDDSKTKFRNLYQTNYDTGIYHLEHGHLWDATFRFKIIKRYWPNELQAQYMYAYCLVLQNMNNEAEKLLIKILAKDPDYEEAMDLLSDIENDNTQKIVSDYNNKVNKFLKKETQDNKDNEDNKDNK